jgi:hypothetical protein
MMYGTATRTSEGDSEHSTTGIPFVLGQHTNEVHSYGYVAQSMDPSLAQAVHIQEEKPPDAGTQRRSAASERRRSICGLLVQTR